jgi:hypothetical protein
MNDDSATGTVRDSLTTAKDSLTEVQMSTPLDTIVRHGRATRRRHRLIGLAGTGAVAVTGALVVGLTGVIGSAPAHHAATIRTAAFTLVSNANGTATLTINPRVLLDPGTLQSDLKQDGIPAMVRVGSFCSSDPPPAGLRQVVSSHPKPQGSGPVRNPTLRIHPAAMPAGTELSFGNFQLATRQQTTFALIDTGSYTCSSTPPAPRAPGAMTLVYDHPAS